MVPAALVPVLRVLSGSAAWEAVPVVRVAPVALRVLLVLSAASAALEVIAVP